MCRTGDDFQVYNHLLAKSRIADDLVATDTQVSQSTRSSYIIRQMATSNIHKTNFMSMRCRSNAVVYMYYLYFIVCLQIVWIGSRCVISASCFLHFSLATSSATVNWSSNLTEPVEFASSLQNVTHQGTRGGPVKRKAQDLVSNKSRLAQSVCGLNVLCFDGVSVFCVSGRLNEFLCAQSGKDLMCTANSGLFWFGFYVV